MTKLQRKLADKVISEDFNLGIGLDVEDWASSVDSAICKILLKDDRIWKVLHLVTPQESNTYFSKTGVGRAKGKFKRLIKGEKPTKRTPWISEPDEQLLYDLRKMILSQTLPNGQKELELDAFKKWGPQGGNAKLEDLISDILDYFDPIEYRIAEDVEDMICQKVIDKIVFALKKAGLTDSEMRVNSVSLTASFAETLRKGKLTASAGLPVVLPRRSKISIKIAFKYAKARIINLPNMIGSTLKNMKKRLYWSPSFAQNLDEGRFTIPLVRLMRKTGLACFQAMENLDFIGASLTKFWGENEISGMFDYVKMDTRTGLDAMRVVHKILKHFLITETDQQDLWRSLYNQISVDLLITEDLLLRGLHGTGSGSRWTNFVEVIYNFFLIEHLKYHTFVPNFNKYSNVPLEYDSVKNFKVVTYINGDDLKLIISVGRMNGCICSDYRFFYKDNEISGYYTLEEIFVHTAYMGGEIASLDKQEVSTTHSKFCQFHYFKGVTKTLQYINQENVVTSIAIFKSIYLLARVMNSIVNRQWPLTKGWTLADETIRVITILEKMKDNALHQPLISYISKMMPGNLGKNLMVKDDNGEWIPFFTKNWLKLQTAKARNMNYNLSWNIASATLGFENFLTVRVLMSQVVGNTEILESLKEELHMYNSQLVYMIEYTRDVEAKIIKEDYSTISRRAPKSSISEAELRAALEVQIRELFADGLLTE